MTDLTGFESAACKKGIARGRGTAFLAAALGALLLAACGSSNDPEAAPSQDASAPAPEDALAGAPDGEGTAAPAPESTAGAGRSVEVSNDLYEFAFSYPDAAGGIAPLKAHLDDRLDRARAELVSSAEEDRASAKKEGFPYHAHSYSAAWKVVTDLPGWLSLSAELYGYTGGAHGMSNFDSLLWDRSTESTRQPLDLFTSPAALSSALRQRFCNALDAERVKRRGAPTKPDDIFGECIDPVEQTVLLGSSNGKTFDRIGFEIAPYSAGPYAEGSYEVTLPVDGAVMRALKPQYRTSFSPGS